MLPFTSYLCQWIVRLIFHCPRVSLWDDLFTVPILRYTQDSHSVTKVNHRLPSVPSENGLRTPGKDVLLLPQEGIPAKFFPRPLFTCCVLGSL